MELIAINPRARFLILVGLAEGNDNREIQGVLESIPELRTGAVRIPSSNRHVRAEMQGP